MTTWSPEQWTIFFGAVGGLIAAIGVATAKIIEAVKGVRQDLAQHEAASEERLREYKQQGRRL